MEEKLDHPDLAEDLKKADIVCFTETHLKSDPLLPQINNYKAIHSIVNRNNFLGRNIKGVSVYFKDCIPDTKVQEIHNENGNLIIIKIENRTWIDMKELFVIICYKEDRESKYKTNDYFEILKHQIITHKMEKIIIVGDLNGRIGNLNDNESSNLPPRTSKDSTVNGQGKEIIEFCNETSPVSYTHLTLPTILLV